MRALDCDSARLRRWRGVTAVAGTVAALGLRRPGSSPPCWSERARARTRGVVGALARASAGGQGGRTSPSKASPPSLGQAPGRIRQRANTFEVSMSAFKLRGSIHQIRQGTDLSAALTRRARG